MLVDLLKNRILYAEDAAESGSDTQSDTGKSTPESSGEETGILKLTPEELQKRLEGVAIKTRKEAKATIGNEIAAELGYENRDDLMNDIAELRKKRDAEKTDLEKALEENARLQKQIADEKLAREQVITKARAERLDAALEGAIRDAKANTPSDVLALMKVNGLPDGLIDDEGAINADAIKKAVEDYRKAKPDYFRAQGGGSTSNGDATGSDFTSEARKQAQSVIDRLW